MHPLFRSRAAVAYGLAWLPIALMYWYLFAANQRIRPVESLAITVPTVAVLEIVCLAPWYICKALPLRSSVPWKLAIGQAVPAMFFSGVVLAANHAVLIVLGRWFPDLGARFALDVPVLDVMSFLTYGLSVALHYVFQAVEQSKQAEVLSREAQLKALKAQVNPHFLFNSLNSISALTAFDASRARAMCIRLSDFLRSSLRLGERPSIDFSEELALAQNYLDVEQVRFGERLRIRKEVDEACAYCQVPPLLIQPLIENAIKHGIATLVEGGEILISATAGARLTVVIENDYDPDAPAVTKTGFGIANVRSRLEARYGAAGRLELSSQASRFRAVLEAPCRRQAGGGV